MMAEATIDGDTKIRLANLCATVATAVTITAVLVGMRGDITALAKSIESIAVEMHNHNKAIQENTAQINELRWRNANK